MGDAEAPEDGDDYDVRDDAVRIIGNLLGRLDPTDHLGPWLEGITLLFALDEDAAMGEIAELYSISDEIVAIVAEDQGIELSKIVDHGACSGCGENVVRIDEYAYMTTDEVWAAAGDPGGYWCIGCLEERLGRQLVPEDFADLPLTTSSDHDRSDRLQSRIGTGPALPG
jgi:hypothetical protein